MAVIELVYVVAITTKCHQLLESMPLRGKAFCCHINSTIKKNPNSFVHSVKFESKWVTLLRMLCLLWVSLEQQDTVSCGITPMKRNFSSSAGGCTNTESSYNTSTLIGNWNEQRFDINRISKPKPIPSQVVLQLVSVSWISVFFSQLAN